MRTLVVIGIVAIVALVVLRFVKTLTGATVVASPTDAPVQTTALTHTVRDIDGNPFDLTQLHGKVVMIVNVASRCGFTRQYEQLEALYRKYGERGLVIVGFPSNDFGGQEPGTDAEIREFCTSNYGVTFPMMSKITVKGSNKHPVYRALTEGTGPFAGEVGWNFTKFVIARDGKTLVARFGSSTRPDDPSVIRVLEAELEKAAEPAPARP